MTPRQINHRRGAHRRPVRRSLSRGVVVLTVGASVLGVAGTAQAYYRTTGTGTHTVSVGSVLALSGTASTTTALYPGGAADLKLTVTNPYSQNITVTAITLSSVSATGCTTPDVTLSSAAINLLLPYTLAPGPHSGTANNGLLMGSNSSSDCQGKTLNLSLTISGTL
jgi:hypothetical protein